MIYITGGISILATGMMSLIFMPVMYQLAYTQPYWATAPANQLVIRDNLYNIFLILPIMTIGAIILWMYMASARKDQGTY
jgi:Na+/phosphate symporter